MSLLRKSLQNYTKARSASSQSQSFSDANSQKENVPGRAVLSASVDEGAVSSKQPRHDHTPTSRLAHHVAITPTAPLQSLATELSQNTVRLCAKASAAFSGTKHNSDTTCCLQPVSASNSDRVRSNHTVSIMQAACKLCCSTPCFAGQIEQVCCALQPVLFSARQRGGLLDSPALSSASSAAQTSGENLKVSPTHDFTILFHAQKRVHMKKPHK